jgi:K+ transporter
MKRVFVIGTLPNDRIAKNLIGKLKLQDPIKITLQTISLSSSLKKNPLLDCSTIFFSETSHEDTINQVVAYTNTPIIVIGEHKTIEKIKPNLNEQKIYYSCNITANVWSIIRAIASQNESLKLQIEKEQEDIFLKLTVKLKESKLEKIKRNEVVSEKQLTFREALVLKLLFQIPQEPISYKEFSELGIREESLPVYISHLRKILGEVEPSITIKSLRKQGYFLCYAD